MRFLKKVKPVVVGATIAAACMQAPAALGAASDWRFEVLLDDKQIGYHDFSVSDDGGRQVLETEASFDVKFLFITAFRYRHQNTEIWDDGCLSSIVAATNNNGDMLQVNGRQVDDTFAVSGESGELTLEQCVRTFAYWNPEILRADKLLNSQTGAYENVSIELEGEDQVIVDGSPVNALRYRLSAAAGDIRLWYSSDVTQRWLALEAPAKGGRTLRYRPIAVPGGAAGNDQLTASR